MRLTEVILHVTDMQKQVEFYRDMFGFGPGRFPVAESVSQRTVALPFHARLSEREVDLVAQTMEVMLKRENLARP